MRSLRRVTLLGLSMVACTLSTPAVAETASAVRLDHLVADALAHAPDISASTARTQAASARAVPPLALPDPSVELGGQAMGVNPPGPLSMLLLEYRQELPYPGKRAARGEAMAAEIALRTGESSDIAARIVEEVRIRYARIYAADRELRALRAADALLEAAEGATGARYATGGASREAQLKLTIASARLRQRRAIVEAERAGELAGLLRLLGPTASSTFPEIESLPEVALPAIAETDVALEASPEVVVRKAERTAAARRLSASRVEEKPDFMMGAGAGVSAMPGPIFMFRFGMQLPFWRGDKQARLTEAARHDLQAAEADLDGTRRRIRADLVQLRSQWDSARVRAEELRATILPATTSAIDAALAAYAIRQGEFASVLEDLTMLVDAQTELARAESDRFVAWAGIQRRIEPVPRR
jgi:outer membrane protein TolC